MSSISDRERTNAQKGEKKNQVLFKEGVKCLKFKSEISIIEKKYITALMWSTLVVHRTGKQKIKEHLLAFPEPRPPLQGAACPSV